MHPAGGRKFADLKQTRDEPKLNNTWQALDGSTIDHAMRYRIRQPADGCGFALHARTPYRNKIQSGDIFSIYDRLTSDFMAILC
jgi:hypothetical protein